MKKLFECEPPTHFTRVMNDGARFKPVNDLLRDKGTVRKVEPSFHLSFRLNGRVTLAVITHSPSIHYEFE